MRVSTLTEPQQTGVPGRSLDSALNVLKAHGFARKGASNVSHISGAHVQAQASGESVRCCLSNQAALKPRALPWGPVLVPGAVHSIPGSAKRTFP